MALKRTPTKTQLSEDSPGASTEKCAKCTKIAKNFVGCLGCEFWVCVDCAVKALPGTNGRVNKDSVMKEIGNPKNFYEPWQFLCPHCIDKVHQSKKGPPPTQTPIIDERLDSLTAAISSLQESVMALNDKVQHKQSPTWADIVQSDSATVSKGMPKAALSLNPYSVPRLNAAQTDQTDEYCTRVVLSGVPETGTIFKDLKLAKDLLHNLDLDSKTLVSAERLGRKQDNGRPRLLKITCQTEFDARILLGTFREQQDELSPTFQNVRMRPSWPREVREKARSVATLNSDLKRKYGSSLTVSYSLRDSGDIWKFELNSDGMWIRDRSFVVNDSLFSKNQENS